MKEYFIGSYVNKNGAKYKIVRRFYGGNMTKAPLALYVNGEFVKEGTRKELVKLGMAAPKGSNF